MAVNKKNLPDWDALIARAAAEVRQANPHIGDVSQEYAADIYAELAEESRQLEQVWDEIDQQRGAKPLSYTAADAVNDDRGE